MTSQTEDVWGPLAQHTLDGMLIPALAVDDQGVREGRPPAFDACTQFRGNWEIRVIGSQNVMILDELDTGATSVWLQVVDPESIAQALPGVLLDLASVVLDLPHAQLAGARAFLAVLGKTTPATGTNLGIDVAQASDPELIAAAELAATAGTLAFVIDATRAHEQGSAEVGELRYGLGLAERVIKVLQGAGMSAEAALGLTELRLAATADQFLTIAKIRAARLALASLSEVVVRVHAVTSPSMMARYDAHTNLLRTTVAAFAAAVGGADAVTVLPYDSALGEPSAEGRRWARNISSLLQAESHLGVVADPAGGSYAVEQLTDQLVAAALASPRQDHLSFAQVTAARQQLIATRQLPIVGVSEFPNAAETLPTRSGTAWTDGVARYAEPFEVLRDTPPAHRVFVATMGPLVEYGARASYVSNLLAAGGVAVDLAGVTHGVDEVLAAYADQPVACLAGSDAAYAEWGADLIAALRAAGVRRVLLAGQPKPETVPADQVDDSAAYGDDALAFLTRTREALG